METKTLAILAFIFAFVIPLVGLILGIVAVSKISKGEGEGKGLAIAAIAIGAVFTLIVPILLVCIGSLAYFGVMNPSAVLPEKCSFPISLTCVDWSVTPNSINLILQNGAGRDMMINSIEATSNALVSPCYSTAVTNVRNGEKASFNFAGCNYQPTGNEKNRYDVVVTYTWADNPTITHTMAGELLAGTPNLR
jgi:hypothetical protein